jgi:hypothetical protein
MAFNAAFTKKDMTPLSIWPEIEGLAFALADGYVSIFQSTLAARS